MKPELGNSIAGSSSGCRQVVGVPKKCWCGEVIVTRTSKTEWNPYRRYYRCVMAADKKFLNDEHVFKWVDEALYDEIRSVATTTTKLSKVLEEHRNNRIDIMDIEKAFENLESKLEVELIERMDAALAQVKSQTRKMLVGVVAGCIFMAGMVCLCKRNG